LPNLWNPPEYGPQKSAIGYLLRIAEEHIMKKRARSVFNSMRLRETLSFCVCFFLASSACVAAAQKSPNNKNAGDLSISREVSCTNEAEGFQGTRRADFLRHCMADWRHFATTEGGDRHYVDVSSLRRLPEARVSATEMIKYRLNGARGERSVRLSKLYFCDEHSFKVITATGYSDAEGRGRVLFQEPVDMPAAFVGRHAKGAAGNPGRTVGSVALDLACSKKS
jgi:hypothetical protein